ncbi:DnaT-like ssDNA-binding domain-containing protein [Enterobacter chengduensis]|uniref:DnaT-like ssDNA-binding domain-containing protein n=1 Tax=Enterobacter chengduensis TaxID=2494701 RepID=UPI000B4DEF92|nr:DnaT-like ssDNA-binding domain-containing protein [Enterobacter chengduensis]MDL0069417.1 DnaT-like ssDNA-binding domain-containing protein [Enterobacter chengduensis]PNL54902.1 DNA-binding protein [Enterobacter hormaechei]
MSLDAMRWAKKAKTGRSSAKSVLTWLADMCGADLTTYPSIAALSEATELDKKTVQASLQHLIAMGFIQDTGERRGRTKQIPVYKLIGVEESIADSEHTQKREHYQKRGRSKATENGGVSENEPKNGAVKNGETIPFFPSNDPKNGIRNPPEESKDLNPTHSARGELVGSVSERPAPEYPGQPGTFFPASQLLGKFPMSKEWKPSADFRKQANLWGRPVPEKLTADDLRAAHACFVDYWISEGKAFNQTQWEQKFALHLQNTKPTKSRGNSHAGLDPNSTANAAVQRARAARAEQLRARGEGVEILGTNAGNLLHPVGDQKRIGSVGPMDCADWEFDQRPDDERL